MIESGEAVLGPVLENFFSLHPDDAAGQLEGLPLEETVRLLLQVRPATAAAVFERLSPQTAGQALEQMDDQLARMLLEIVDPSRTAPLLLRLGEEVRERRLASLNPRTAAELTTLMTYPPDSAGQLMDPRVSAFRPDATVEQVMERLRSLGRRRVHDILLMDGDGLLIGSIPLQDLVPAPREKRLEELVHISTVNVLAVASREEVVEILDRHRLTTLPVVDIEGRLLGAIRYDALVRAVEQEAPEVEVSFEGFRAHAYRHDLDTAFARLAGEAHAELHGAPPGRKVSTATTDARYVRGPCLCYGPVAGNIHGIDEWVDLVSVRDTALAVALIASRWCG